MFSDRILDDIRSRINIVDVISPCVPLKKSGQGYLGLCPFHKEKTPSFHVHPTKQIFHCFGCQKGGNLFTFVCAYEGITFPEAVRALAKQVGVEIEPFSIAQREKQKTAPLDNRSTEILNWATRYFHHLLTTVQKYHNALDYLHKRGIGKETIKRFELGVAPTGWDTLIQLMLKRKFTIKELVLAGLAVERTSSTGFYDRFRGRLMFPIKSSSGNTVGFGARILGSPGKTPKYLNSPESQIFSKGSHLYGLFENQRSIRLKNEVLLVEGYMDVIGLSERGIDNALATMGTALTQRHCHLLKTLTRKVTTIFDPDAAGFEAWHRSVHFFIENGIFAKDLTLPSGQDPDEFVATLGKNGSDEFQKLCDKAPRQITKLLKEITRKGTLTEQERSNYLNMFTPILLASKSLPDRALIWDQLSLVIGVSIPALKELAGGERAAPKSSPRNLRQPVFTSSVKRMDPLEREFMLAVISNPGLFLSTPKKEWIDSIREPALNELLCKLHESGSTEQFRQILDLWTQRTELPWISSISPFLVQSSDVQNIEWGPILNRLRQKKNEEEIKILAKEVRLAQDGGTDGEQLQLLEKLSRLRSGRRDLII